MSISDKNISAFAAKIKTRRASFKKLSKFGLHIDEIFIGYREVTSYNAIPVDKNAISALEYLKKIFSKHGDDLMKVIQDDEAKLGKFYVDSFDKTTDKETEADKLENDKTLTPEDVLFFKAAKALTDPVLWVEKLAKKPADATESTTDVTPDFIKVVSKKAVKKQAKPIVEDFSIEGKVNSTFTSELIKKVTGLDSVPFSKIANKEISNETEFCANVASWQQRIIQMNEGNTNVEKYINYPKYQTLYKCSDEYCEQFLNDWSLTGLDGKVTRYDNYGDFWVALGELLSEYHIKANEDKVAFYKQGYQNYVKPPKSNNV